MNNEKIILAEDPEAAHQETLTLWVSRNGKAYKEEKDARYDGSTHKKCDCGGITEKYRVYCDKCAERIQKERYNEREKKEWNGEILYSQSYDKYFYNWEDIEEFILEEYEENGNSLTVEDLLLDL